MAEKIYTITNDAGLHARPSTALVTSVTPFNSEIVIEYNARSVNIKSIMGVMSLGIPKGAIVKVTTTGDDELQVLEKIDEIMKKEGLIL
nr:phosphocarrier protein HPr [uncultured Bacillus sp.]